MTGSGSGGGATSERGSTVGGGESGVGSVEAEVSEGVPEEDPPSAPFVSVVDSASDAVVRSPSAAYVQKPWQAFAALGAAVCSDCRLLYDAHDNRMPQSIRNL